MITSNFGAKRTSGFVDSPTRDKRLKTIACDGCRRRKVKCDGDGYNHTPCKYCTSVGLECTYGKNTGRTNTNQSQIALSRQRRGSNQNTKTTKKATSSSTTIVTTSNTNIQKSASYNGYHKTSLSGDSKISNKDRRYGTPTLSGLSDEIMLTIFKHIRFPISLLMVSKNWHELSKNHDVRASWMIFQFGKARALFYAIRFGPNFINVPTINMIIEKGGMVSRYLVQKLLLLFGTYDQKLIETKIEYSVGNKDIEQIRKVQKKSALPWGSNIPLNVFTYILLEASKQLNPFNKPEPYIDLAIKGNDEESFHFQSDGPHAINQARQKLEENLQSIKELILKWKFIPFPPRSKNKQSDDKIIEEYPTKGKPKEPKIGASGVIERDKLQIDFDILESEESSELVSEDSQSTIISEISNETVELELDKIYFEESQELDNDIERIYEINNNIDEIQEINSNISDIDNIDDNISDVCNISDEINLEFHTKRQESNNEIEKIQEIDNNIDSELNYFNIIQEIHTDLYDSKIGSCSKTILASEIIEIIDSDNDLYEN
ncbi:5405_t:CDS:2 [Scutellospora calospora]|uniref:5405_t:CDS:1 n=1 Tax=Scutellospora calospora TaxID=85575 RepID=A0ACA9KAH9_9GLOM|nr:5405_t:CDS:2 [Scutellospora calospora]